VDIPDNACTSWRGVGDGGVVIYVFGDYELDTTRFELSFAGRAIAVEPQVLELLIFLIDHRDRVVTRTELFDTIWKGRIVSDTTLSSRIKTVRKTIGDDDERQRLVKTIHGRGFRFTGDVTSRGDAGQRQPTDAGPVAPARPQTRYARAGDVHIAYQTFGDGPGNLVLTPGFVSHIDNYWDDPLLADWLTGLGRIARVAMFDKRGTGLSDRVTALPGMDERMDDVRAVMDAAGFESAFIMGISEGGSLATLFAAHHPARCRGLILYGAFAQFRYWYADAASLQQLFDYIESDWGTGASIAQFAPSLAGDARARDWWGRFERLGATPGAAIALMTMNSRIDISDVLPGIRVPCLVIHRKDDGLIDVGAGRELARRIPGADYLELPGNDHLPWVGDADRIVEAVREFLRRPDRPVPDDRSFATLVLVRLGRIGKEARTSAEATIGHELLRSRAVHVEKRDGDFLAAFDGPTRALESAVLLSRLLSESRIAHRIGLHAGEIGIRSGKLHGVAIAVAADVCALARTGTVLVSRTVSDLVAGSDVRLEDRGEHHLPAIDRDWRLYQAADS